ncbi:hypothetical protein FQZ97_872040 [compost metagenome]
MHNHKNLADVIVQLTHDRVEQERHIVIDYGDDADGAAMAFDAVIDADDALALTIGFKRLVAIPGRFIERCSIVGCKIFGWSPFEEKLRKGDKRLRLSSLLLLLACLGTFNFARPILLCSHVGYSCHDGNARQTSRLGIRFDDKSLKTTKKFRESQKTCI